MSKFPSPKISTLICFEAAARHESFTAAAEELGTTQSAVSKSVRDLEAAMAVQLFRRVGRGIKLSSVGREYAADTAQDLQRLEHSRHRAVLSAHGKHLLRIATLPTFTNLWLVPRLPEFLATHPDIELEFSTHLLPFDLTQGAIDLAFHYGHQNWADTQMIRLFGEEMIPVCTPEFFAANNLADPQALTQARLLHMASRPKAWMGWFERSGLEAGPGSSGVTFDQYAMVINAALAGTGAAIVPLRMVASELQSGRLVKFDTEALKSDAAYYIVHPAGQMSKTARSFVNWVRGFASDTQPGGLSLQPNDD